MPDDHSESVPPLPIPNRTVKRLHADDSADSRVKVGHRQAPQQKTETPPQTVGFLRLPPARSHRYIQPAPPRSIACHLRAVPEPAHHGRRDQDRTVTRRFPARYRPIRQPAPHTSPHRRRLRSSTHRPAQPPIAITCRITPDPAPSPPRIPSTPDTRVQPAGAWSYVQAHLPQGDRSPCSVCRASLSDAPTITCATVRPPCIATVEIIGEVHRCHCSTEFARFAHHPSQRAV
jgi:hypothetical protein